MLTEICQYLKNWFNRKPNGDYYAKWTGTFSIASGSIAGVELKNGQYFRIMGSLFNDGVHKYGSDVLQDETFEGAVWSMAVPPAVVLLADEIAAWQAEYGSAGSSAMSPYQSESFGGYSYSKASGSTNTSGGAAVTWKDVYGDRLAPWRRI